MLMYLFGVGEITWGLIFLCFQKRIFNLKIPRGRERTADDMGSLKKSDRLVGGLRK